MLLWPIKEWKLISWFFLVKLLHKKILKKGIRKHMNPSFEQSSIKHKLNVLQALLFTFSPVTSVHIWSVHCIQTMYTCCQNSITTNQLRKQKQKTKNNSTTKNLHHHDRLFWFRKRKALFGSIALFAFLTKTKKTKKHIERERVWTLKYSKFCDP